MALIDVYPNLTTATGAPLAGALMYVYAAGTTTLLTVYQDSLYATPATNPVVADASAVFAATYIKSASSPYKLVYKTPAGVTVMTIDNIAVKALYSTGTWTPGMAFGGSSSGVTYSAQGGRYTKIGGLVYFDGAIVLTNNGSGSGAATITGLPVTVGAGQPVVIGGYSGFSSLSFSPVGSTSGGGTTISLYQGAATATSALTDSNIGNSAVLSFSGWYEASDWGL